MQTHNLDYPRVGSNRELKKACEKYWTGKISVKKLINNTVKRQVPVLGFFTGGLSSETRLSDKYSSWL